MGNIPEALTYLQRSTTGPGALRWSAPEQFDPNWTFGTTKTDVYSFGCVALEGSSLCSYAGLVLTSLQVFSGKRPWSEVVADTAVTLCLVKGRKPGRPDSRTLNDLHWNFIQDCWSSMEERPTVEAIIPTIRQFLSSCPRSPPLCDLLPSWSGQADLLAESSPFLSHAPTEGSSTYVTPFHTVTSTVDNSVSSLSQAPTEGSTTRVTPLPSLHPATPSVDNPVKTTMFNGHFKPRPDDFVIL